MKMILDPRPGPLSEKGSTNSTYCLENASKNSTYC